MVALLVQAEFIKDARDQLAARLQLGGVNVSIALSADDVAVRYFDYKQRHIPARPHIVVRSTEFDHIVLPPDLQAGVEAIVEDSVAGRTLVPYLTKGWMDLEVHDLLFNDWSVLHMHLGGRHILPNGLVKRSGKVLFVYLTPENIYFIDIIEHGSAHPTTFAQKRLVQVLHDNWPKLIEHGKMEDLSNLSLNDDHSRWLLSRRRKGGYATMAVETTDGTVYGLIGPGYMSDGRSMEARRLADALLNRLHRLQQSFVASARETRDIIHGRTGVSLDELHLQLELKYIAQGIEYGVRERQANIMIMEKGRIFFPRRF